MKPEVNVEQGMYWHYDVPPHHMQGSKMMLLTTGKIAILGTWRNCIGVIAWYPLPDRNKNEEQKRGI